MTSSVVTRFAPSPTGYLHIGGARTALFNWLYARGRGGKFLLRIEDTDRARHNEAAVDAILDGLRWLGLDWDGEPISQYGNRQRHVEVAQSLLEKGAAYKCYMTPEEIEAARNTARENKTRLESPWRTSDPSGVSQDTPYTIRFRAPQTGETIVNDEVQGSVSFPNNALDDLILIRSDGAPTYNLAVVVDDHDMGVTHVIRGDDHLNNAARQCQIYDAIGWEAPVFAHVPLIHGSDGAKLSKRHGALGVEAYRDMGVLSDALANYLLRLGWSHGDDEFVPRHKAKEWFDLGGINKAPARLDLDKLSHLNGQYVAALGDEDLIAAATPFFDNAPGDHEKGRLLRAAPFLRDRLSLLTDINTAAAFLLVKRPIVLEGKAAKPIKKDGARAMLGELNGLLATIEDWSRPDLLDQKLKEFAEQKGVGFGQIGPPLRAALTGGNPSPSLGEVLYSLGKEEALGRISEQI